MSAASPKPISTQRATATAARPCVTRCARPASPAAPASRCERGRHIGYLEAHIEQGETLESGGLSNRGRHVHRRDLAIPHHLYGRAKPRRHHADGHPQGCRPRARQILRRYRRRASRGLRPAHGVDHRPHHPRSRRAEHHPGQLRKCCSRSATTIRSVIARLEDLLRSMAAEVDTQGRCSVAVERIRTGAPAHDGCLLPAGHRTSQRSLLPAAGHSACRAAPVTTPRVLATVMPAGMLFVPSIGGISHHWTENTADADIVTGAEVFVEA